VNQSDNSHLPEWLRTGPLLTAGLWLCAGLSAASFASDPHHATWVCIWGGIAAGYCFAMAGGISFFQYSHWLKKNAARRGEQS